MSALTNYNAKRIPHPDDVPVPRFSRSSTQAINVYLDGLVGSHEINKEFKISLKKGWNAQDALDGLDCKENRLTNKDTP